MCIRDRWGLALVNESSYGHSVGRTVIDSEPVTMLRLTLLLSLIHISEPTRPY